MATPETSTFTAPEIVISPHRGWSPLHLRELWEHRELIYFLTKRELQVRYKQSFFGVSWAILQPLTLAFIFALFFGRVVKLPTEGIPFAVFAVAGLVPWLFTAAAITNGAGSLLQDANLISKVYFPRLALPISKALSLIVDLAIALPVVVIVTAVYGVKIQSTVYLVPTFLLFGVLTSFALGTLFAALNVKYRDVGQLVPMLVQVMFFATPVLYPGTLVHGTWKYIYAINPMVSVIDGIRWSLLGTPYPGRGTFAVSIATTLLILLAALSYFQRTERSFADVI